MRSKLRKKLYAFAAVLLLLLEWPTVAFAAVPYMTNYKDGFNRLVAVQPAYIPADAFGKDIYVPDPEDPGKKVYSPLSRPKDLFVDEKNHIYIADTGNNRIVQLDENGSFLRVVEVRESPLSSPQGLFVDGNGDIYIADTGNHRILRLDKEGKLIREFKRPETKFLPEDFKYDPIKLVVDKRGFLYIATMGGYQGILQLDPEGSFQNFFGANKAPFSVMDALKRIFYTREMYAKEIRKLPGSVTSVTIDREGFIYTVTNGVESGQVKKLNVAGKDLLAAIDEASGAEVTKKYGEAADDSRRREKSTLIDLDVDSDGNITVVDSTLFYVSQYDCNGNLLFFWGGDSSNTTTKFGLVKTPTAVASNSSNELLILDEGNNVVQKFRLSEFGALVHEANRLTQDGRYLDSEEPWREVKRLNSYYTPAILGLAKAAYKREEYPKAQQLFMEAGDVTGYSDAFWQNRLVWFQKHFATLMNAVLLAFLLPFIIRKVKGKRGNRRELLFLQYPLIIQLKQAFVILKHPLEGFSAIRYEYKGGYLSSLTLLALSLISFSYIRVGTSFSFNPTKILDTNLIAVFIQFLGIWGGWVVSNYLIGSIYRGEARFRDILFGSSYALFPLVLIGIPLTLISNTMSLNESSIFYFFQIAMIAWVAILFFCEVYALQNYSIGETVVNIFLSLVTMAVMCILIFILIGLSSELIDFVRSIYQEVRIR